MEGSFTTVVYGKIRVNGMEILRVRLCNWGVRKRSTSPCCGGDNLQAALQSMAGVVVVSTSPPLYCRSKAAVQFMHFAEHHP